jgi:cysteine synthase
VEIGCCASGRGFSRWQQRSRERAPPARRTANLPHRAVADLDHANTRDGATLAAIAKKLSELAAGARVLGFNYDTGERYLSIEGFLPA